MSVDAQDDKVAIIFQAIRSMGEQARDAARVLATVSGRDRALGIAAMPAALERVRDQLREANRQDQAEEIGRAHV